MSAEPAASQRLERLLASQELLSEMSATLGPDLDLDDVLSTVLEAMRRLVDFRGGSVQLLDERGVFLAASDPPADAEVADLRVRVGEGLSGRVVSTGMPLWSGDITTDDRVSESSRTAGANREIRSYAAVPLVCLGEVIGALQIDSPSAHAFGEDDIALLRGLAAQVAGVIESARRYQLVTELEQLKADFLARVSHELRTPITIIDGLLRTLLRREDLDPEQQRDMLRRCRSATSRLAALVEDLLTLTRLESGVPVAAPVATQMAPLLSGVAETSLRPDDVHVDCPPGVTVVVDPELLGRALACLVDNALKYGARATVRMDPASATIEVSDDGPGLPDDVRSAAFELFTRSGATLSVPGLGLGLPLARTLLDAVGASLSLDDASTGGTVARVRLGGG